jgi:hypothetical protein
LTGTPSYIPIGAPESMEQTCRSSPMGGRGLLVLSGGRSARIGDRLIVGA